MQASKLIEMAKKGFIEEEIITDALEAKFNDILVEIDRFKKTLESMEEHGGIDWDKNFADAANSVGAHCGPEGCDIS